MARKKEREKNNGEEKKIKIKQRHFPRVNQKPRISKRDPRKDR